jgi:Protein of unknown function (DUF4089)
MLAYVRAAAELAGIPVDGERAGRVAMHLARTATLAALLESVPLAPEVEPAALFDPARPEGGGA